jgi:cytochrome c2
VVGRDIASVEGFEYSEALRSKEGQWTFENIFEFIHGPKAWAPGTKMTFAGIKSPEDRADLLVYLRTLSDQPVPLPEAAAAEAAPGTEQAAAHEPAAAPSEQAEAGQQTAAKEPAAPSEQAKAGQQTAAKEPAAPSEQATAGQQTTGKEPAAPSEQAKAGQQTAAKEPAEPAAPSEQAEAGQQTAAKEPAAPSEQAKAGQQTAAKEPTAESAAPSGAAGGVAALLAHADPEAGAKDARKCAACHNFEEGGPAKIGPPLWGVIGREIASVEGFTYSGALTGKEGAWDYQKLDAFLAEPRGWAPGTKMAFAGVKKPEERADVILYLRSLSHDPAPLP